MTSRNAKIGLAVALVLVLVGGILTVVLRAARHRPHACHRLLRG